MRTEIISVVRLRRHAMEFQVIDVERPADLASTRMIEGSYMPKGWKPP
jgi:hypothetical protein